MPLYAPSYQSNPNAILRRKVIYSLGAKLLGHDAALDVVKVWEEELGSTDQLHQGIPQFIRILMGRKMLGGGELAFAQSITASLSRPGDVAGIEDPMLAIQGMSRPSTLMSSTVLAGSPLTKTLMRFLQSLSRTLRKKDPGSIDAAAHAIASDKKLPVAARDQVPEFLVGIRTSFGSYSPKEEEGRHIVHVVYMKTLEGLGPVETDAIFNAAVRETEGTSENFDFSVRKFL